MNLSLEPITVILGQVFVVGSLAAGIPTLIFACFAYPQKTVLLQAPVPPHKSLAPCSRIMVESLSVFFLDNL